MFSPAAPREAGFLHTFSAIARCMARCGLDRACPKAALTFRRPSRRVRLPSQPSVEMAVELLHDGPGFPVLGRAGQTRLPAPWATDRAWGHLRCHTCMTFSHLSGVRKMDFRWGDAPLRSVTQQKTESRATGYPP
jgi:hypothetical protein